MNPKRRQDIELIIITHLVTVMDERGWKVYAIDDGGDEDVSPKNLKDVRQADWPMLEHGARIGTLRRAQD